MTGPQGRRAGGPVLARNAGVTGAHRLPDPPGERRFGAGIRLTAMIVSFAAAVAVFLVFTVVRPHGPSDTLGTKPGTYVGVYVTGVPHSFQPVHTFVSDTKVKPNLLLYYSSWWEPFRTGFAVRAAKHGAATIVQINPMNVKLSDIATGRYDRYINTFAAAVRRFGRPVVVGFGHEMNAQWSPWGYRHANPATFVAAWRHIVDRFRTDKVKNVTWLWTVNVIDPHAHSSNPRPWWPGDNYVSWIGIDGYYRRPSWKFAALFGPTIRAVHVLTRDPILISETGVQPSAGKAAKIGNLFAGVRDYGLLGLVWFDAIAHHDWRLDNPAAILAFRRAVERTPGHH
ncbi:MAG: glycoside hydrolase family 26 protein [Streptosporangiaceae bacterium]